LVGGTRSVADYTPQDQFDLSAYAVSVDAHVGLAIVAAIGAPIAFGFFGHSGSDSALAPKRGGCLLRPGLQHQQVIAIGSRLNDAHLLGCVTERQPKASGPVRISSSAGSKISTGMCSWLIEAMGGFISVVMKRVHTTKRTLVFAMALVTRNVPTTYRLDRDDQLNDVER
jgi:hypothetical protein